MKERNEEITPQQKLKSVKFKFWFALSVCIFLTVAIIVGIICILVLTDDIYAPLILAVALAFVLLAETNIMILPAYKELKALKAQIAAFENTQNID